MERFRRLAPWLFAVLAIATATPQAQAETPLTGAEILALAREAAGGEQWANARTLSLSGRAIFYGGTGHEPRVIADDYRMWRIFDPGRESAHGAGGKVRIIARSGAKRIFEVGFDGATTWTRTGHHAQGRSGPFLASNFGFDIIRHAGKPGFSATRLPDDAIAGHRLYMVELTDPGGGQTLFGVDQQSHAIRSMGFRTPKGWHQRHYDDFVELQTRVGCKLATSLSIMTDARPMRCSGPIPGSMAKSIARCSPRRETEPAKDQSEDCHCPAYRQWCNWPASSAD